uniref:WGS project CAEQ00000000 data, annotated contig 1127 n=1 Tax=Trypanosoma congolense (strain IL3000) TaxID=1068625 RepID=F9W3Y5_TRYCI|nr:unnamed protein product [Trypanosoma congolense IL3000]
MLCLTCRKVTFHSRRSALVNCLQVRQVGTANCGGKGHTAGAIAGTSVLERFNMKPEDIEKFLLQRLAHKFVEVSTGASPPRSVTSGEMGSILGKRLDGDITAGTKDDVRFHRRLSTRFTSQCDQEKVNGAMDVSFDTVHRDVRQRLSWAHEALSLLNTSISHCKIDSHKTASVPQRLVVLVLYSHTRHNAAVGFHMKRIRDIVNSMLAERHEDVLGVLNVVVGVRWRDVGPAEQIMGEAPRLTEQDGTERSDILWYPNAGMYTFNALLQCLADVSVCSGSQLQNGTCLRIHRKILIISEGWFHVRTAAQMHSCYNHKHCDVDTHHDTVHIEPMPFVLGSSHSEHELLQFARYTASRALA